MNARPHIRARRVKVINYQLNTPMSTKKKLTKLTCGFLHETVETIETLCA